MTVTAYIALGSNLGDRRAYLDQALIHLRQRPGIALRRVSSWYETAPVGGPPGQGMYLNAAAQLETDVGPLPLLRVLLEIEQALGRVRGERCGPRTIDLDLLLYGNQVQDDPELTLPHARLAERRFVLEPLAEIAPWVVHPVLGKTVHDLLTALPPEPTRANRELVGARAVVTGATSGIGRAVALELAAAGADVLVHGRRADAAEAVAAQVRACGVQGRTCLADLRDPAQAQELAQQAWSVWPKIDMWINNAGADLLTGEAAHWPFERKLAELWAVDVTATLLLSRAVGQRMVEAGGGVLLNLGWDQAETGMEGDSGQLFATAKAAVMAFSKSLALTLAPVVRVNCVAPGWIRTAWGEHASDAWQQRVIRETPLQRWGRPEDVAATIRWLVSPKAAYITGQTLHVNGGAVR